MTKTTTATTTKKSTTRTPEQKAKHAADERARRLRNKTAKPVSDDVAKKLAAKPDLSAVKPMGIPKAVSARKSATPKLGKSAPKPTAKKTDVLLTIDRATETATVKAVDRAVAKSELDALKAAAKAKQAAKADAEKTPHPKALAFAVAEARGFGLTVRTTEHASVRAIATAPTGQVFEATGTAKRDWTVTRTATDRAGWLAERRAFWSGVLEALKVAKTGAAQAA